MSEEIQDRLARVKFLQYRNYLCMGYPPDIALDMVEKMPDEQLFQEIERQWRESLDRITADE